mmetsp:Transcript_39312/g.108439  ORF Transcript_39312/g.108439 Transcript_39312/m.108439 type:complete len:93 (+) Transcript_39312:115-393(+)
MRTPLLLQPRMDQAMNHKPVNATLASRASRAATRHEHAVPQCLASRWPRPPAPKPNIESGRERGIIGWSWRTRSSNNVKHSFFGCETDLSTE